MFRLWSPRSLIFEKKPYSRERLSQRGDKEACDLFADSLSYSKNNGDKMTDDKTTKELMKALIDFLQQRQRNQFQITNSQENYF